ncbi:MAG: PilZ domain-containing protein [Planctomycetota bacterium]
MGQSSISDIRVALQREISRFLQLAARPAYSDLYHNRRGAIRYHRACPLFVARLDSHPAEDISVTLHDISNEGIGFYCDQPLPKGCIIGIKLFWAEPNAPRVPAVVRHQELTQQGFLVGAQFAASDAEACARVEAETGKRWYD